MNGTDIVVYGRDERVVAVVEVKASKAPSPRWAADLRAHLLSYIPEARDKFMILIGRKETYLWSGSGDETVVATSDLLGSYLQRIDSNPDDVPREALELIVGIWLSDLTRIRILDEQARAPWLRDSGLLDAIKDGRVEFQEAA